MRYEIVNQLNEIIDRHINTSDKLENRVKESIKTIIDEIDSNAIIGVKGAGDHTLELFHVSDRLVQNSYVFDKKETTKTKYKSDGFEFDVYPDEMIDDIHPDIIIISSYTHRHAIKNELYASYKNIQILDLYDELEKRGIIINFPFFRCSEESYENVVFFKNEYSKDKNQNTLKNLIAAYLHICDFINFFKLADVYIDNKYDDSDEIEALKGEINDLLIYIKSEMNKRTSKDIVMLWNDQLGISEFHLTTYMKKISKKSMFFENAYAASPFTFPAVNAMIFHRRTIDDNIYWTGRKVANRDNSALIKVVENYGYKFVYDGDESDCNLFEEKYCIRNEVYNSSCVRFFKMLQYILNSDRPVFCILHALVETHNPYLSADLERAKWYEYPLFSGEPEENALKQMEKSLKYWDKQVEFYTEFLPSNCVQIFMSDHGKRFGLQPAYKDPSTHIIFFIYGKDIKSGKYDKIFSLFDLDKVAEYILNSNISEEYMFSEYAIIQETNIFNPTTMQFYFDNNAMDNTCAFRSVRTKNECYVRLDNGKCFYYLMPDENNNMIECDEYRDRVKVLDGIAGHNFGDTERFKEELEKYRKSYETHE